MTTPYVAFLRVVPMLVVMGTIFILSHQPGDMLELPGIVNIDKAAHMFAYGVLAGTVIVAFSPHYRQKKPLSLYILTVTFCMIYGICDEFHQTFIAQRFASVFDVLADTAGALVVAGVWYRYVSRSSSVHDCNVRR